MNYQLIEVLFFIFCSFIIGFLVRNILALQKQDGVKNGTN